MTICLIASFLKAGYRVCRWHSQRLAKLNRPWLRDDLIVKLRVDSNPKLVGSHARKVFALYVDGMTTGAFKVAVDSIQHTIGTATGRDNLRWDYEHGFIDLVNPGDA